MIASFAVPPTRLRVDTTAPGELARTRPIVTRTRGRAHGPITRLVSPSDLGALIKPFVFLDRFEVTATRAPTFGFHPHSGIATVTLQLEGGFAYEDSTGATGTMQAGDVEYMQAGGGVWHAGRALGERIRGFQLWIALPAAVENAPPRSRYVDASQFGHDGPARVVLGTSGAVASPLETPASVNVLDVHLAAGQVWRYEPPAGHDVAWVAVHGGTVTAGESIVDGELVVFAAEETGITFRADTAAAFVLGSAPRHPHPLVLGAYSVHSSAAALALGEAGIERVARELQRAGKL